MSLHLVTGYAGKAHVTSADQGAFNAGVVGTGEYVMCTGNELSAQIISNNQIRIFDGDIMMQGRHICLKKDTCEDVAIANGLQGLNRNDLIVLRYTKDSSTGVESIAFAVLQGVSTEGTASDPAHTTGDILSGECLLHEMPLYRVQLTGLNVGELVPLFAVVDSMAEMEAKLEVVNEQIESCFQSVSDGKALVASAITDKGVPTDATSTFSQMANNIANIQTNPVITKVYDNAVATNGTTSATTTALSYTVQSSGQYIICASSDGSTRDSYYFYESSNCQIRKNGTTIANASNRKTATSTDGGGASQGVTSTWSGELSAGDTISLYGYIKAYEGYHMGLFAHMQIYKVD